MAVLRVLPPCGNRIPRNLNDRFIANSGPSQRGNFEMRMGGNFQTRMGVHLHANTHILQRLDLGVTVSQTAYNPSGNLGISFNPRIRGEHNYTELQFVYINLQPPQAGQFSLQIERSKSCSNHRALRAIFWASCLLRPTLFVRPTDFIVPRLTLLSAVTSRRRQIPSKINKPMCLSEVLLSHSQLSI